jgi:hypothetical protein
LSSLREEGSFSKLSELTFSPPHLRRAQEAQIATRNTMNAKKKTTAVARFPGGGAAPMGRKSAFGRVLHDDPYTTQIQSLFRKAKSSDEVEARPALLELFYRFHLRLPLEEARLRHPLPWNRRASQN